MAVVRNVRRGRIHARPGEIAFLWVSRGIIWLIIVAALIPMLYVVTASFNPTQSFFSASLIPPHPSFYNYQQVFKSNYFLWLRNSTLVAVIVAAGQLGMTSTAAYAFSRMRFLGRGSGLKTLIILQMFPNSMAIAAIYAVLAQMQLLNHLWVYILLLMGGSAFSIWLMKGYYDSIPRELDESAFMDGASHFQVFWKVVLPLARPMLAVIFFLNMIGIYSEYILASTVLQSNSKFTIGLGMYSLIDGGYSANWGEFAAAALLTAIPLTIIFAILNPIMAKGLIAGALKG